MTEAGLYVNFIEYLHFNNMIADPKSSARFDETDKTIIKDKKNRKDQVEEIMQKLKKEKEEVLV